jgi:hypothetical protein
MGLPGSSGTARSQREHDQSEQAVELREIILALMGPDADAPYEDFIRIAAERSIPSPVADRWLKRWTEDGTITVTRPGYIRWNARSGP